MPAWIYLALAITAEVIGTVSLRNSDGFSKLLPSAIVVVTYGLSFYLLALCLKKLEIGIVYAVWAGVGTAAIAVIGIAAFDESVSPLKLASIALVILGVVGLSFASSH